MRYVGRSNQPLTGLGGEQAAALGKAFRGMAIDRVLSSPMQRASSTAAPIAAAVGREVEIDERLIEQDFGDWEGLTRSEIEQLGDESTAALRAFDRDPGVAAPNGESQAQLQDRTEELCRELSQEAPMSVVLVSHVGPIKALLASVLDVSLLTARRLFLDPGTVTVADWQPWRTVRLFNCHVHQGWQSARWMTPLDS